jgi:NTP pyrophosphatase (non-canonical NTP hydrolase)
MKSSDRKYAILRQSFPYDILQRAQAMFGREYQMGIVVEECSELQKALLKNTNRKKENIDEIIDETADVYIGLLHIVLSYNINDPVAVRVREKLTRLEERLKIRETASDVAEYTRMIEAAKNKKQQGK